LLESWDSFFVAETAAAAALLGLLFVAVSINLKQIVDNGGLADRALGAMLLLLAILIAGLLLAMPDQPVAVMGIETAAIAVLAGGLVLTLGLRGERAAPTDFRSAYRRSTLSNAGSLAPILIGGLLMLGGGEAGFYFVAVGMCLALIKAVGEGWILLVEINR
jgi:hypothetical protein